MKTYACILAAGIGSRLGAHTKENSKWMVEINGSSLVHRYLNAFKQSGINDLVIVTGHASDKLINYLTKINRNIKLNITYIYNKDYRTTNNIYSLYLALLSISKFKDLNRLILAECDLFISNEAMIDFLSIKSGNYLLASPYLYWMDGSCIKLNSHGQVSSLLNKQEVSYDNTSKLYKTVNWYSFDQKYLVEKLFPFVDIYNSNISSGSYYELVIRILLQISDTPLMSHIIEPSSWMEIDDSSDLEIAECLDKAINGDYESFVNRFGGFWKFPWLTDLTLLVNPYFPSLNMKKEISETMENALINYPSSQKHIKKLISKTILVEAEELIVGNGVCELMSNIMPKLQGSFEIIEPFFLEYQSVLGDKLVTIKNIQQVTYENNLILVNPNNPDGRTYSLSLIYPIIEKLKSKGKYLIYDESFSDFYQKDNLSLLDSRTLEKYENVICLKSFGKTYGVPGVRLGILANSNKNNIANWTNLLPIWNINSLAEVFLDLLPKYKDEYKKSLEKISNDTKLFYSYLEPSICESFSIIYPEANFLLLSFDSLVHLNQVSRNLFVNGYLTKSIISRPGLPKYSMRLAVLEDKTNIHISRIIKDSISNF